MWLPHWPWCRGCNKTVWLKANQSHTAKPLRTFWRNLHVYLFLTVYITKQHMWCLMWVSDKTMTSTWYQILPAVAKQHPPPTSHLVSLDNLGNMAVSSLAQRKLINFSHDPPLKKNLVKTLSEQIFVNERRERERVGTDRPRNTESVGAHIFVMHALSKLKLKKAYTESKPSVMKPIANLQKRCFLLS